MLFFTGVSRLSSEVSKSQILNMKNCSTQMNEIYDMVKEGSSILSNPNTPLEEFGKLLNKAWKNKKSLSHLVTNSKIDELYNAAILAGAVGGKILGAGGGGFVLFFVKPENQENVKKVLSNLPIISVGFVNSLSTCIKFFTKII